MPYLKPLEFRDGIIDSPGFRANLRNHSKHLKTKSKRLKHIISATERLFDAFKQVQQAHGELGKAFLNYDNTEDSDDASAGSNSQLFEAPNLANSSCVSIPSLDDTDDDLLIKNALPTIFKLLDHIENLRAALLEPLGKEIVSMFRQLRKNWLSGPKTCLKTYNGEKANFAQKLEKYMSAKPNDCTPEMDEAILQDRLVLMNRTMDFVSDMHKAEELIRSEFLQNVMLMIKMFATSYHEAHENYCSKDKEISSIIAAVQRSEENFDQVSQSTYGLRKKLMSVPWEVIQTTKETNCREGYLFVQSKKTLVTQWTEYFCAYSNQYRKLTLVPYSRCHILSSNPEAEYYNVQSFWIRPPNHSDRRFCFDIKVSDKTVLTLQAQSQADLHEWMRVMGGTNLVLSTQPSGIIQEKSLLMTPHILAVLRRLIEEIEGRDLKTEGLYRVSGNAAKINALVKNALKPSGLPEENLEDYSLPDLASAVKQIFRSLNEPILTYALHTPFREVTKLPPKMQLEKFKNLLVFLPPMNQNLLRLCITHLSKVTEFSEANKMSASNLSLVFAPTLLRLADESVKAIMYNQHNATILQFFIENCHILFPDQKTEPKSQSAAAAPDTAASPVKARDSNASAVAVAPSISRSPTTGQAKDNACSVASDTKEYVSAGINTDISDFATELLDKADMPLSSMKVGPFLSPFTLDVPSINGSEIRIDPTNGTNSFAPSRRLLLQSHVHEYYSNSASTSDLAMAESAGTQSPNSSGPCIEDDQDDCSTTGDNIPNSVMSATVKPKFFNRLRSRFSLKRNSHSGM